MPISTKSITRQVSTTRKKKRAAGLRIGYKKDDFDSVVDSVGTGTGTPRSSAVPSEEIRINDEDREIKISQVENCDQEVEANAGAVDDDKIDMDLVRDDGEKRGNDTIGEEDDRESEDCSIKGIFEKVRNEIMENLKRARERVDSVSEMRKESIRRRRKAAEDLSLTSTKYRELKRQLEEACKAEDFEMADRLLTFKLQSR